MLETVAQWAEKAGWIVAWGSPTVLEEVRGDIERRRLAGEIDAGFYAERLASYMRQVSSEGVESLVVVAVPRPAHEVIFDAGDIRFAVVVPPTYAGNDDIAEGIRRRLESLLAGASVTRLIAPVKAVASRLGVVKYGRNNITYAPGFGSYHQLTAFLTSAPLDATPRFTPGPPAPADECDGCFACGGACPTGAIAEDRFLLHTERCLALFNERVGPWPEWVSPSSHNCLVGCMACQDACPMNAGLLRVERLEPFFDPEETSVILGSEIPGDDPAWTRIRAKFAAMGLEGLEGLVGRNLRALLEAECLGGRWHGRGLSYLSRFSPSL
ncbi:MAG: hypothetical protein NUV93_01495 [Firmicutes bacterium]|jgi:epoxyqueuosine reductase|nr:hypothetical protein [Bacillota bacterium]